MNCGCDTAQWTIRNAWPSTAKRSEARRRLAEQLENARLWGEVCVGYFGRFAGGGDSEKKK